ncbi:hypothetical protein VNO77_21461 [Canavalia gladiata]|uniref:Uncharacterized protein n=1 Tax=Canavalia gladiata TaxID=3824 RepID=A0AAN9LUL6_CANGL
MVMKQGSILVIVWVLFGVFSHSYGSENVMDFCPITRLFYGSCPNGSSGRSCLQEFQDEVPDSNPHDCVCDNVPTLHKRRCTCSVNC